MIANILSSGEQCELCHPVSASWCCNPPRSPSHPAVPATGESCRRTFRLSARRHLRGTVHSPGACIQAVCWRGDAWGGLESPALEKGTAQGAPVDSMPESVHECTVNMYCKCGVDRAQCQGNGSKLRVVLSYDMFVQCNTCAVLYIFAFWYACRPGSAGRSLRRWMLASSSAQGAPSPQYIN